MVYSGYFCRFLLKDEKTNPIKSPPVFPALADWIMMLKCREWREQMACSCRTDWLTLSIWRFVFPPLHHGGVLMTWHAPCQLQRFKKRLPDGGSGIDVEETWLHMDAVSLLPVLVYGFTLRSSSNIRLWQEEEEDNLFSLSIHCRHLQEYSASVFASVSS